MAPKRGSPPRRPGAGVCPFPAGRGTEHQPAELLGMGAIIVDIPRWAEVGPRPLLRGTSFKKQRRRTVDRCISLTSCWWAKVRPKCEFAREVNRKQPGLIHRRWAFSPSEPPPRRCSTVSNKHLRCGKDTGSTSGTAIWLRKCGPKSGPAFRATRWDELTGSRQSGPGQGSP